MIVLTLLYTVCAALLTIYTCGAGVLLVLYLWQRRLPKADAPPPPTAWPHVTVQLPVYNERHVIGRLLDAVAGLDYPPACLTVQIIDDSDDETTRIVTEWAGRCHRFAVQHLRRPHRDGYKAGALAYGLLHTDAPFVAVFDADFVPPSNFLRRTVPHLLAQPNVGLVQGRWGHLNPFDNPLTLGQTLAIDAHFLIEQSARTHSNLLLSFNGTGGVWRAEAIAAAGGWRATTLTEDLDLSYRAQFAGWRLVTLPEVVVPGELPPQLAAYKQQQARWARGNTQCLVQTIGPLWRTRGLSLAQRLMGMLHLCQYLPQVIIVLLLLLTPPLMLHDRLVGLWPLGLAGGIPPAMYLVSQRALYADWPRRLLGFPGLLALGTGITVSNTWAVLNALVGVQDEFRRTPKFVADWSQSVYALRGDATTWAELALAGYALWGAWMALAHAPALVPYMLTSAAAYGMVGGWGLIDRWRMGQARRLQPAP